MNTAEQILVVILSTALAVLLVLAIMTLVAALRLFKTLQAIADKAETFVENAEHVGNLVKQTVGHLSIARFVKSVVDMVHHSKEHKKED